MAIQRMSSRASSLGAVRGFATKRGMVLPFTPLSMSFDNVNYYVDMPPVRNLYPFQLLILFKDNGLKDYVFLIEYMTC